MVPDIMLELIRRDGYSLGEMQVVHHGMPAYWFDAAKDGERWRVIAPTRCHAICELMVQLGWDLEDGYGNYFGRSPTSTPEHMSLGKHSMRKGSRLPQLSMCGMLLSVSCMAT